MFKLSKRMEYGFQYNSDTLLLMNVSSSHYALSTTSLVPLTSSSSQPLSASFQLP